MPIDARPTIAAPDDDPYLWLEEIEGERALAWVEAAERPRRCKPSAAHGSPPIATRWRRSSTGPTTFPSSPARRLASTISGRTPSNPRGLWRRTTLESFRSDQPAWEILLDIDALAAAEGEDWIWGGATTRPARTTAPILQPVARRQRRRGAARVRPREQGLRDRTASCCRRPRAASSWLDRRHAAARRAPGAATATTSGYARTVRLWRRGTDAAQAPVLFEMPRESMSAGAPASTAHGAKPRVVRRAARLLRRQSLDGGRRGRATASSSTCRPTSRC